MLVMMRGPEAAAPRALNSAYLTFSSTILERQPQSLLSPSSTSCTLLSISLLMFWHSSPILLGKIWPQKRFNSQMPGISLPLSLC